MLSNSLADGATLSAVEGALPVSAFAGALAVVGGGRVWWRLSGVAIIAGLWGAISYPLQGMVGLGIVGLLLAVGFLAWVSPRTLPPRSVESPVVTAVRRHVW